MKHLLSDCSDCNLPPRSLNTVSLLHNEFTNMDVMCLCFFVLFSGELGSVMELNASSWIYISGMESYVTLLLLHHITIFNG